MAGVTKLYRPPFHFFAWALSTLYKNIPCCFILNALYTAGRNIAAILFKYYKDLLIAQAYFLYFAIDSTYKLTI